MKKLTTIAMGAMLALATPALASGQADGTQAERHHAAHPAQFIKGFFTAAIDVAREAAQATSDTLHHNTGNAMNTVARARGFVRDTVSGVLGNARKASSVAGEFVPFTERHYHEKTIIEKNDD